MLRRQPAEAVTRVFAAVVGRDDEPDLPTGWQQFGVDEHGRPLYGWIGRPRNRNPRLDLLAEALRKRYDG